MNNNYVNLTMAAICGMVMIGTLACTPKPEAKALENATVATAEDPVKKGEYLVGIMGCHDCHSPKVFGPQGPMPDPEKLLSGHPAEMPLGKVDTSALGSWVYFNHHTTAAVGPWGASYAANLTSDETGIGNWTIDQFKRAVKEGKYKGLEGGRMLLPPMPWPNLANLTDADLNAIFAYLKSTKPVKNVVPAPTPLANL